MLIRTILAAAALLTALAYAAPSTAQETPGYALELSATLPDELPGGPCCPGEVERGTLIRYTIEHTVPTPVPDVTYTFYTPPGTLFVSAEALDGAEISTAIAGGDDDRDPVGRGEVLVSVEALAPVGAVEVRVRVNDTYQGSIEAIARFVGGGPGDPGAGASNTVIHPFNHGDGVPGSLAASSFVDMNGNLVFDADDVGERCRVYVYEDLTGETVPAGLTGATDARLPLASVGDTDETGTARINLFAGAYTVMFGSCDTPLPPSGAPQTAFEIRGQPPVSRVLDTAANYYEVQGPVTIESTEITTLIHSSQPVGAAAPPTDVRFDGPGTVRWVDRAEGETSYQVTAQSGALTRTFELPADSTSFTLPEEFRVQCGQLTQINVAVAAVSRGAAGYPVRAQMRVIADCALPITPPRTGHGAAADDATNAPVAAAIALAGIGAALTITGSTRRWKRRTS